MRPLLLCVLLLLPWFAPFGGESGCAASIQQLRLLVGDPAFPLRWEETSMDDGKPMRVSIGEGEQGLRLEFVKSGEGMWAEGIGEVCRGDRGLEARLPAERLRLGPAANWLLRLAMHEGAVFTLRRPAAGQLHIATTGWSGRFIAADH